MFAVKHWFCIFGFYNVCRETFKCENNVCRETLVLQFTQNAKSIGFIALLACWLKCKTFNVLHF